MDSELNEAGSKLNFRFIETITELLTHLNCSHVPLYTDRCCRIPFLLIDKEYKKDMASLCYTVEISR
jgi:hypothetical protein